MVLVCAYVVRHISKYTILNNNWSVFFLTYLTPVFRSSNAVLTWSSERLCVINSSSFSSFAIYLSTSFGRSSAPFHPAQDKQFTESYIVANIMVMLFEIALVLLCISLFHYGPCYLHISAMDVMKKTTQTTQQKNKNHKFYMKGF